LVLKREELQRQALDAFIRLATYHETYAEYELALQYAYRQLELEPWREEAHRQVIRLLALTGQLTAALAQYETCRQVLAAELNTEPSPETVALMDSLRSQGSGIGDPRAQREPGPPADPVPDHRPPIPGNNLPRQLTPFIGRK